MIDIFTDLRDLHTNYILPSPYSTKTAFLPFLLEEFREGGVRRVPRLEDVRGVHPRHVQARRGRDELERHPHRPRRRAERRSAGGQQPGRPACARPRGAHDPRHGHVLAARRGLGDRRVHGRHDAARGAHRLARVRARPGPARRRAAAPEPLAPGRPPASTSAPSSPAAPRRCCSTRRRWPSSASLGAPSRVLPPPPRPTRARCRTSSRSGP